MTLGNSSDDMCVVGDLRFGHSGGGICHLKVSPPNLNDSDSPTSKIFTCGSDGEVRVYKNVLDNSPTSILVGDEALTLAVSRSKFFASAPSTNTLKAYDHPGTESADKRGATIVCRFTGDVSATCLNESSSRQLIAAGSDDTSIKVVVNGENFEEVCHIVDAHDAPILALAFNSDASFLASSSCDGSYAIWKINANCYQTPVSQSNFRYKCVSRFKNVFTRSSEVSISSCISQMDWHPTHAHTFAIPHPDACIKVYALKENDMVEECEPDLKIKYFNSSIPMKSGETFEIVRWIPYSTSKSKLNSLILAASNKGLIVGWRITSTTTSTTDVQASYTSFFLFSKSALSHAIRSLTRISQPLTSSAKNDATDNTSTEVGVMDDRGFWGVITLNLPHLSSDDYLDHDTLNEQSNLLDSDNDDFEDRVDGKGNDGDDVDEDALAAALFDDTDDSDQEDNDDENKQKTEKCSFNLRKIKQEAMANVNQSSFRDVDDVTSEVNGDPKSSAPSFRQPQQQQIIKNYSVDLPDIQEPFQPGGTEIRRGKSRYLMWNCVGTVRIFFDENNNDHDDDSNVTIEVEFHDASTHHPIHLSGRESSTKSPFVISDLSSSALALATEYTDSSQSAAILSVYVLNSSSGSYGSGGGGGSLDEWNVRMPGDEEDITAVCVSDTVVVVSTDLRHIRIFSIGGVQRQIFSLIGPIVCMAVFPKFHEIGSRTRLCIAQHNSVTPLAGGSQSIHLQTVDFHKQGGLNLQKTTRTISLSPGSKLSWMGFSESSKDEFVTVDSCGVVRFMCEDLWFPIADVKQSMSSSRKKTPIYSVISFCGERRELTCLKSLSAGMEVNPKPIPFPVTFSSPVCTRTGDVSGGGVGAADSLENELLLNNLFLSHHSSLDYEKEEKIETLQSESNQLLIKLFALSCKQSTTSTSVPRCLDVFKMMNKQTRQLALRYASKIYNKSEMSKNHFLLMNRLNDLALKLDEMEAAGGEENEKLLIERDRRMKMEFGYFRHSNASSRVHNDFDTDGDDYGVTNNVRSAPPHHMMVSESQKSSVDIFRDEEINTVVSDDVQTITNRDSPLNTTSNPFLKRKSQGSNGDMEAGLRQQESKKMTLTRREGNPFQKGCKGSSIDLCFDRPMISTTSSASSQPSTSALNTSQKQRKKLVLGSNGIKSASPTATLTADTQNQKTKSNLISNFLKSTTTKDDDESSKENRQNNATTDCIEDEGKGKNECKGLTTMKGFQLWLAENRDSLELKPANGEVVVSGDHALMGLDVWKALPREVKDTYKVARVPILKE